MFIYASISFYDEAHATTDCCIMHNLIVADINTDMSSVLITMERSFWGGNNHAHFEVTLIRKIAALIVGIRCRISIVKIPHSCIVDDATHPTSHSIGNKQR